MTLEDFLREWHDGREQLLVHTSGSTGQPKPLWVEKRRMEASARMTCRFLGLKKGDTALLCLPLDYIAGKMMVVRSLVQGLQLTSVEPCGHPLAGLLAPSQIDFAAMVPMQVWNSLQVEEERNKLREIRHLIIGGGAVDASLARELADFPHAVWSTYGMTETLSHVALRRLSGAERTDYYTPMEGVEVRQTDDGCLAIRAPHVCEGELLTNDRVELWNDESGQAHFRILGRKDNVICSGGMKIQAEEVEQKLRQVMDIPYLISRVRDKKFGELVVLLLESSSPLSEEETEKYKALCASALQRYERPRLVLSVGKLPLTETGKPARGEAERLIEELSHRGG